MIKKGYPNLSEIPYYNTPVSVVKSRSKIIDLLEKYGIKNHMWGTFEGKEAIQFQIHTTAQGVEIKKMVRIDIPNIKAIHRGKLVDIPRAQVLRFIYYTLKSILEATQYGIFRLEHLLMSYILTQLDDGKIVQIKDVLEDHPLLIEQAKGSM